MARIITTYIVVLMLVSLGFFGVGTIASAQELRDPMQPPPFALQKFREAKYAANPKPVKKAAPVPKPEPMRLSSIIYSPERKVAIIDGQMLSIGDRIRGAELVSLTRDSARLVRKGKVIKLQLGSESNAIRKKPVESKL